MLNLPKWMYAVVALLMVAGLAVSRTDMTAPPDVVQTGASAQTQQADDHSVVWSHGQDGTSQNAEGHWEKHGHDFPEFHDAQEYEQRALAFVRTPPAGTLTKHRSNGDTLFYDPVTNTFAVADRGGEPRTFFRPNNGQSYWNRQ